LRQLRATEQRLRSELRPREQPAWIDVSGSDPYRIVADARGGFVGILRGARSLVTLDRDLRELSRISLPEAPTALCSSGSEAFVASRFSSEVVRVELEATPARVARSLRVRDGHGSELDGIADIACAPNGLIYVLPAAGGELLTLDRDGRALSRLTALPGGLRLLKKGNYLFESSLFERAVRVLGLDARGVPQREVARVHHDGPIWAFDALEHGGRLWLALAGAEDKPLVRAHGEFENIDSFVWLYRLEKGAELTQAAALDASELGVVVPKAIALRPVGNELELEALGAGSGALLRARVELAAGALSRIEVEPALPGASDAVFPQDGGAIAYASPLFDAWVSLGRDGVKLTSPNAVERPPLAERLGEALFFTELMAPDGSALGSHSRFSCETCHFEGGVDGRTHYTGRGNVSVVTKPLFGLANNRPHFSRALDPDLSAVSHNEFRVAGAGSGRDPWFTLETRRFPWLRALGIDRAELEPLELREALLTFLYGFSHAPNARAQGRARFTSLETAGADTFAAHCASCHSARLFSDRPESTVPRAEWQELVLRRNAPIVWARGDYARTGVEPYVHELGTRIPSLRRLRLKPRYFTKGSARTLSEVLQQFREGPGGAQHQSSNGGAGAALSLEEQRALAAFLQLL
jgi:hypothetical protein